MKRVALAAVAALALTGARVAHAQDDRDPADAPAVEPHAEGVYGGVNPIAPAGASKVTHRDATARKTLHWIGFQQERGATEVFLQAVEPFTIEQRVEGGALVIAIGGLTRLGKNIRRPLDTRFFDGPIVRITSKPRRARRAARGRAAITAGIDVTIAFRSGRAAAGEVRTATGADGMYYAQLTFAGGSGEAPATQPSTP
jgi:hypothetical protein